MYKYIMPSHFIVSMIIFNKNIHQFAIVNYKIYLFGHFFHCLSLSFMVKTLKKQKNDKNVSEEKFY
jgi:hypothetical protein